MAVAMRAARGLRGIWHGNETSRRALTSFPDSILAGFASRAWTLMRVCSQASNELTSCLSDSPRVTSVRPNTPMEEGEATAANPDRREGCEVGSYSDSLVSLECFLEPVQNRKSNYYTSTINL